MTKGTIENKQQRTPTILMIDDDKFMREIFSRRFTKEGFSFAEAMSGEQGLKMAKELKPDLILLDVLMPILDGFEVLGKLKSDPELASIPVIMLTSLGNQDDIDRGLQGGAVDYMLKSHTPPLDAITIVRKALNKGP